VITTNVVGAVSRPPEVEAFLTALQDLPPHAPTGCVEWTVHDVGAHLAGIYEEVVRHVEAYSEGRPLTATRTFEEREARFKAFPPDELLATVDAGDETMRSRIAVVLDQDLDAALAWTGREMRVDAFPTHLRSECAIHRRDMVGDDETSGTLLGEFALLKHAVTAIGAGPICARGIASGATDGPSLVARIRSPDLDDLVVTTTPGSAHLGFADQEGAAAIECDEAARLLLFWGRDPEPANRLRAVGPETDTVRIRRLFSGY
jgi:hypothetical protein